MFPWVSNLGMASLAAVVLGPREVVVGRLARAVVSTESSTGWGGQLLPSSVTGLLAGFGLLHECSTGPPWSPAAHLPEGEGSESER